MREKTGDRKKRVKPISRKKFGAYFFRNVICISNGTFLLTVTVYCYIIQLSSMYYGGPL